MQAMYSMKPFTRQRSATALLSLVAVVLLSSCSDSPSGSATLNQTDGMVISPPEFLTGRTIVRNNLDARVSVDIDGVNYPATRTSASASPWVGQVFFPSGSSPTLNITWVETGVAGLPDGMNAELPLAFLTQSAGQDITVNQTISIDTESYSTNSTEEEPLPLLDTDLDGFSNLTERQVGSRPADAQDIPPSVTILYNNVAPVIDGRYDPIWARAQFLDQDREALNIENVVLDDNVVQDGEDRGFKWAAMHDGQYLYVLVFGQTGAFQTPRGDSELGVLYHDDSVDIYWDGNNSKGSGYDGLDDFHIITPLLGSDGLENQSGRATSRIDFGVNAAPLEVSAIQFGVCSCDGDTQLYEFRIDLNAGRIPVDSTFGFEININDDVDGMFREVKWAWFNDTGDDDTWRFPLRMGNVRLEPLPL